MPAPPVVEDAVVDVNCSEGLSVMSVNLMPPGYKGSGTQVPFAESGTIVRYFVTAVPTSGEGDTIYVEGGGDPQPDGSVRCQAAGTCCRLARHDCVRLACSSCRPRGMRCASELLPLGCRSPADLIFLL